MPALAVKVRECLSKHSESAAQNWDEHFSSKVSDPDNLGRINKYLRTQLGLLPVITIDERECLDDSMSEKDWLRCFKKYVAPTIVQHGLPAWS